MRRFAIQNIAAVVFAAIGLMANAASAEPLKTPTEKPILTISGKISSTNEGDTAQFDRGMLESLGMEVVETTSPWYKGPVKFEGISLDKLMKSCRRNRRSGDRHRTQRLQHRNSHQGF